MLNNTTENDNVFYDGHYVACVVGIIGIIGVTVNLLTVAAILRHKTLRQNASTVFVINLSISDFIYSFTGLPIIILRHWSGGTIDDGFLCYCDALFHLGHYTRCMLSMMAITLNRYILICKPTIYAQLFTIRKTVMLTIGIWIISILQLVPTMTQQWGQAGRSSETRICTIVDNENGNPKYYLIGANTVIPIITIIICYICIYKKVKIHDNNKSNMPTDIETIQSYDKKNYENGPMIKLMMIMLISFIIIYLTLPIVIIIDPKNQITGLRSVAVIIYSTHVIINPFIFYGNNKVYRLAFKQMIYPRFSSENTNSNQIK